MCPVAEGSNVSAPALLPSLRRRPSEPGGVSPDGSFEDRSGTMPLEYGSPHHPLLIDPTMAARRASGQRPCAWMRRKVIANLMLDGL
eukprot:15032832-Heterocapsa_arctica.AAC.1